MCDFMKKFVFVLISAAAAMTVSAGINSNRDVPAPTDMNVEPGTHSCVVTWSDDYNSAWNLRYRLYAEEPAEPVLLHSVSAASYTGNSYDAITLPAPWGGTNVRAGNREIYFRNNYNNDGSYGNITYTIPEGYYNDTFTLMVTTYATNANGAGNLTVATPQTEAVTHYFSAGDTYYWVVTASSGEKITITTPDSQYSPSISLMEVYSGDATSAKLRANEWTYVNNLSKTTYTIEGLEINTDYEVQVQAIGEGGSLSDWCKPDVFTTLEEEPFVPFVHILGDIDDQYWAPDIGTKMEYDPENELYTATIHVEEDRTFGFSTELDVDDLGGWNYLLPYRFGPESDGEFVLEDEYLGQTLPLSFDNYGNIRVLTAGDYEVTVSLENNYIIIGKISGPDHGYDIGDVNHNHEVGISDVSALIDYLLDSENNAVCPICADVNGTDGVTIADVSALIDMLLSM